MPIYEYQCSECGAEKEVLQKISDAPLTECPSCGKPALRKKVSAAAFRLKGSGWYETDFKSGSKKNLAGDSGSDSGKAGESAAGGATKDGAGAAAKSGDSTASKPAGTAAQGSGSSSA